MKKIFFIGIIIVLLGLNIATLISSTAYSTLYGIASHLLPKSLLSNSMAIQNKKLKKNIIGKKAKAKIMKSLSKIRIKISKIATSNLISIPTSSIPIAGIVATVAGAGAEIYLSCESMKELDVINAIISPNYDKNQTNKVCGIEVPTIY